jgi:hypothetical protein
MVIKDISQDKSTLELAYEFALQHAVRDIQVSRRTMTLDDLRIFETRVSEGIRYVGVPRNIDKLVQEDYLILLGVLAVQADRKSKIHYIADQKLSWKHNEEQTQFLHGFGLSLALKQTPLYRTDWRGDFKLGVLSCFSYQIGNIKSVDKRFFRLKDVPSVLPGLYGQAWAIKHEEQKRILDYIISVIGQDDLIQLANVEGYLLPIEQLKKELGLKTTRHKNKLISAEEQKFLEHDFAEIIRRIKSLEFDSNLDWTKVRLFMKTVQQLCKDAKNYRTVCEEIVDRRASLVFKGKKGKKNLPIEKLIESKSNTPDYIRCFNPCRAASWKTQFTIGTWPESDPDKQTCRGKLNEWLVSVPKTPEYSTRKSYIESWYVSTLAL